MMNINWFNSAIKILILALSFMALPIHANEWWDSYETPPGFSEFAPPSSSKTYSTEKDKFKWRSGSSFKDSNKLKYLPPVKARNPWKSPVSKYSKQSFSSSRPWGRLPEKRPQRVTSMRFHDQRFIRWSHDIDSSYHNNFLFANQNSVYDRSSLPFVTNYGFPGSLYNSPLITPGLYPISRYNPISYGAYPGVMRPYSNMPLNAWRW